MILHKTLISLFLISLLTACGWHLRGQANLPASLRILDVSMQAADFTTQKLLKQALQSNGVTISADASYRLHIVSDKASKRTLTVTSSAKASSYELKQVLSYQLFNEEGLALMVPTSITSYRTQEYDADATIAKANEEQTLRIELKRDNVNKLLKRLAATQVSELTPIQVEPQDAP